MNKDLNILQVSQGSLIFSKPFTVSILPENKNFTYQYIVYKNDCILSTSQTSLNSTFSFYPEEYSNFKISALVFKDSIHIATLDSNSLDFIEDFVYIDKLDIVKTNSDITINVLCSISPIKQHFAYYLKKDNIAIEKIWYKKSNTHTFYNLSPGSYSIVVYSRLIKNNNYEDLVILETEKIIL
ncbi:Uncharacterised protein [[Clostridium] sordellii]|uniref:hypothetical protein n=1 Tax=Paraclostridium sordellii TaxID=1505 RepID=UPI0005DE7FE1|nr:hypothetical protein [Paeniclostridium sordellii]AUN14735.1 hypothetical protein RSJ16_11090 [Paeniclostridium sordellii]MBS6024364.1 hypothetical protein [Paeniclostridium sordellii]MBX9181646.1 hypothetical protein [Paeniclostridium sordellii]CEN90604.1 Uncharacterised protein [[Clostridium] sordellii] [Paeniclostridium sordellii]CEO14917.1 Uncharacterised protein [[Clostridium] sordellii] [Paeniclostridium sordellii]